MAVFWLLLYIFVNLTSIIWLGSIAVTQVAGVNRDVALIGLGAFALLYQLKGGLKAVALTDIVQVTLLVRSEEHTSELQSLMRISYAVFCLKKKTTTTIT